MIYLLTLVAILCCAVYFDLGHVDNPRLKNICYMSLLIWFTAVSGFAYNVGSDIPGYMRQYAEIASLHFESWDDLSYFENRQPGWMILNVLCTAVSSRFVVLQCVIAIFANCVFFYFIKEHTKYIFIGVFLYAVCLYLNFNFNTLRQTISIAFFLVGYEYLLKKKWSQYYIYCFAAFMFHSTAAICFLFPLFYFVRIDIKWLFIYIFAIILIALLAIRLLGEDLIKDMMIDNADSFSSLGDNAEQLTKIYFGNDSTKYDELNLFGLIAMLLYVSPIIMVCIASVRQVISLPAVTTSMLAFYMFLYLLDFVIPVVFMRFLMYLDLVYFCAISDFVIDFPKRTLLPRNVVTICLLCLVLYRPVLTLFAENISTGIPFYKQFYPYYSVFDPQIDPVRSANFGAYKEVE